MPSEVGMCMTLLRALSGKASATSPLQSHDSQFYKFCTILQLYVS